MKRILSVSFVVFTGFLCFKAQSAVITSGVGANTTTRICPLANSEQECIEQSFTGLPNQIISDEQVITNGSIAKVQAYNSWAAVTLDKNNLSLPEVHFYAQSNTQERATGNVAAYQQYIWNGNSDVLTFTSAFDYTMSAGDWNGTTDSYYSASIVLFSTMYAGGLFPRYCPDPNVTCSPLAITRYYSGDYSITGGELVKETISVSLNVENGDTFYLMSIVQGGGMNGGWVDSANTLVNTVTAQNASVTALYTNLRPMQIEVDAPATAGLFSAVLLLLFRRKCG